MIFYLFYRGSYFKFHKESGDFGEIIHISTICQYEFFFSKNVFGRYNTIIDLELSAYRNLVLQTPR